MIYKKCIMTINKNSATLDEDIYLFRLDKNIELHFTIVNNKYKFDKSDLNNIIAQTQAAYFQIRLYRSDEIKYTFAIQPTQDGVAVLTITDDLINDPIELGEYDFQISLLDVDKTSMISMPIVKQQLHVCEPLVDNQAIMGKAVLGLSSLASGEIKNAFDSEGNYIREVHNDGDILSAQLVNKFEEALDSNTKAIKNQDIPHTISSKVLVTVPASSIKLNEPITVNNITLNKDRKYYIEFMGSKELCNATIGENITNELMCITGDYVIQALSFSSNLMIIVHIAKPDITATTTFTDLIIYEEEIECLDNKYLENDLRVQNSISLGRVGDTGAASSAVGMEVQASGMGSHAEGYGARAIGNFSHAEGSFTEALEEDAHAEGSNTIASSMYQHVQGKNNIEDKEGKYAHIVGNGEDLNNRANAHTLDWQGNGWFAGKLSQEGAPTEDKDLTTKKYVDDKVTVKILPVDYNKNCATNVIDLEPNSIYMSPNDAKFLYLVYEKLSGSLVGFLFTAKAHGRFIYTGVKDDTKIEIMMEGSCYTVYFKTDTVDAHVEKTVFYLTKNNKTEFTPTNDYEPATKKYVDDKIKDTLVTTNISGTTLALTANKYQTATVADGTEITLPTVTSFTEIHLFFSTTTDLTLTLPACKWQNGNTPTIAANKTYEFIFTYTTEWLGGVIEYV